MPVLIVKVVLCKLAVVEAMELPVLEEDEELELLVLDKFVEVLVSLVVFLEVQQKHHRLHNHLGSTFENIELCCLDHRSQQAKSKLGKMNIIMNILSFDK